MRLALMEQCKGGDNSSEVVSATNQLKLLAPDGKHRMTDVLDYAVARPIWERWGMGDKNC